MHQAGELPRNKDSTGRGMRASQIRGGQAAAAVTRLPSAATAAAACRHRQWSDCGPSHVQAAGHLSSQRLHDVARWGDAVQGEGGRGGRGGDEWRPHERGTICHGRRGGTICHGRRGRREPNFSVNYEYVVVKDCNSLTYAGGAGKKTYL